MKPSDPRVVAIRWLAVAFATLPLSLSAGVRINEVMSSNSSTVADEDGMHEDWIELHNPTLEGIDLGGWGLTDDPAVPFRWTFAAGTVIEPGGHLLVWASGKDRQALENPVAAPDALGGLVTWLRADMAAFADGQAVATWQDSSGSGNHATQPIAGQRPTFSSQAINGLPALSFNRAASQQLFLPTASFNGMSDLSNFTFLAVARWTGGVTSGLFGGYRGANTANTGSSTFEITSTGGGLRLRLPSPIDATVAAAVTPNQWHLLGAAMDQPVAKARIFRDGALLAEASGNTGTSLLANFERLPVGSSFDNTRTFGGQIAEVLLYNRSLSALELASLERHFAAKYNLTLQTPPASSPPHTNFRIAATGEALALTRPDGSTADLVDPVALPADISYGRPAADPATWSLLQTATPGAPNLSGPYVEPPAPVAFSHPPGVHAQSFSLALSHPDPAAVIVYTLDGSEPDLGRLGGSNYRFRSFYNSGPFIDMSTRSLAYQGPIPVSDRSTEPNRISLIPSTSDSNPSYLPFSPVKKATVVRARAYVDGVPGAAAAATYFVSSGAAFDYPVSLVSMFFNEADFFDYDHGIYVAGVDHVTSTGGRVCNWGNFNRGGTASERAGHFQLFDQGSLALDQAVGFRIHGNCSRRNAFKSLRVIADRDYEARNEFDHPFFDDPVPDATVPGNTGHKALILRSPSINEVSFCRLYQPIYGGVGGRLRHVIQFLNGEYWGLSYLRDRLDENYLARHYDLDPENLALVNIKYGFEVGSTDQRAFDLDHGIPADMDDFTAMRNFITSNSMASAANYDQARGLLDMDSFIDHLILKIFAGDDHYAPEYVFWRAREPRDDGFGDGRWRVIVKDFDSSLFTANYVSGLATGTHPRPFGFELFQSLLANPSFRNDFINRFADLLNAHFQPARFQAIIQAAYDEAQPLWNEVSARWNNVPLSNPSRPFTAAGRDALLAWSNEHPPRQRGHLRSHFGISSDVNLTVDVADPARGHVRVNTLDIAGATPGLAAQPYPWTGVYFHNIPVTLAARPATGHRFAGWRLNGAPGFHALASELTLTLTAATAVEAVFEPLSPLHGWDFENALGYLQPSQTAGGGASLAISPGPATEVLRNTAAQDFPTAHLRVNHPLGAALVWSLPTTGFGNLALAWQTRRSGQGAGGQTVETTTDGVTWSPLAGYVVADAAPQARSFDLTGIPGVENNPLFAVRITFDQGAGGTAGNHRFDNFQLSGTPLPGGQPPAAIAFDEVPAGTSSGAPLPPVRVRLLDGSGFPAVSYNGPVTLSLTGTGVLGGTLTVNAVNGTATFADLVLTGIGGHQLIASAAGLAPVPSALFRSLSLTELTVPRFIQGGIDGLGENNERVPFAWRGRVEGLAPDATYRFANRAVLAGDSATSDGAGNMIFIADPEWIRSTASPGFLAGDLGSGHFTFTAGADGTFTGWFLTEPTGNARFTPGNAVHFRLLLNDGAGGQAAAHVLTTGQSAQVLRFGSGPGDGSAIAGQSAAAAGDIAVLFGDAVGTTRPLAATPLEATGATVDTRYAPFYQSLATLGTGRWGNLLPNQLAGGLRRIEVRSPSTDAVQDLRIAPDGFAGTLDPSGGLNPLILDADAGLPVLLPVGDASWQVAANWSTATIPDAAGATAIVPAPSSAERFIGLSAAVTLGHLRFRGNTGSARNHLRAAIPGASLAFDGAGPSALLRIEDSAPGSRADLDPGLPVHLGGDLLVDDGGHTLGIAGPISGNGHAITKTGVGTLELAGASPPTAPPVQVLQGTLIIAGSHPAAITLAEGTTLSGSGGTGPLAGAGTVSTGTSALTALSSSVRHLAAVLAAPGTAIGNGTLVLTDPSDPLPEPPQRVDLFLAAARQPGDRFTGGLRVSSGIDLAAALAAAEVRLLVPDPAGEIPHLGQSYRPALPADLLTWSVVSRPEGNTLEVLQGGAPATFTQWRNLHFADSAERADDAISGPAATSADGVPHLIRYAHGAGPDDAALDRLPQIIAAAGSPPLFRFRYDPAKTDIDWLVRSSTDLGDWSTVIFDSGSDPAPAPDASGWTHLPLPAAGDRRFLRLEVRFR
jgi:hypothetical protein